MAPATTTVWVVAAFAFGGRAVRSVVAVVVSRVVVRRVRREMMDVSSSLLLVEEAKRDDVWVVNLVVDR